eukprot:13794947-Alexandrium_andersonii.AAC.1
MLHELGHSEQEPQVEFNLLRASCAGLGDPLDTLRTISDCKEGLMRAVGQLSGSHLQAACSSFAHPRRAQQMHAVGTALPLLDAT